MSWKLIGLLLVLADFSALSAYAVYQYGFVGVFELALANVATVTLFADLVISLSLIAVWMVQDARSRGTAYVPYLVIMALAGSIGPLLYLIRREWQTASEAGRVATIGRRATA
jgi:hypothetical protein